MSPPGRTKGESLTRSGKVSSIIPPGRPKGESLTRSGKVSSINPQRRPKGEFALGGKARNARGAT